MASTIIIRNSNDEQDSLAWGLQTDIYQCIVDETRALFKSNELSHVEDVFKQYDEVGEWISLNEIDTIGFNLFYKYCNQAMENFPNTESGKQCMQEYIPAIQAQFAEVLRLMREDERYQEELQAA